MKKNLLVILITFNSKKIIEKCLDSIDKQVFNDYALFIIDILREKTAIREARKAGIKVFAIVDSNVDPSLVDHPIPGNDDAKRSIKLLASAFTDAVIEGQALKGKENI